MPITQRQLEKTPLKIIARYDIAADAKKRISLRNAQSKYFHIKAFSNGCFLLEPRVLAVPRSISPRSLAMLEKSVGNLKKGAASKPVNLDQFRDR